MNLRLILETLTILLLSTSAVAENKGGLAPYGAMHKDFPCSVITKSFEGVEERRVSILWHTFGQSFKCLDEWAADPRPLVLQTHLINEVCHRNNRCGKYEITFGESLSSYRKKLTNKNEDLLKKIKENISPIVEWYKAHPSVGCVISAGLESNLNKKAYVELLEELSPLFPEACEFVWNPVNNNPFDSSPIKGLIHELHGDTPSLATPCIVNLDGVDVSWPTREAILPQFIPHTELRPYLENFSKCSEAYIWVAEFNGIAKGPFIDPRKRTNWPALPMVGKLRKPLKMKIKGPPEWTEKDDFAKVGCSTFLKVADGDKKDFLWKQSEPACCGRGAVTFLPTKYNEKEFNDGEVFVMKRKKKIALAYEKGVYTHDGSNRQFFRYHKLAKDFPYNIVAHFGKICAVLENPKIRND